MTDRSKRPDSARSGEARLVSVSRYGQPTGPAQLAETFLAGGGAPISDSGAVLRWGLRRYAWLVLLCVAVVGVLLPMQQLNKKPVYTSESLIVAVDLTADLKTLPRLGEAVFDDGAVAQAVSQKFGTAGDAEDVVPKQASVITEQDSLAMHVQGHSRDSQKSADIANVAASAFVLELNKTGSGVGSFRIVSTAVPPVERDEPLRAAPYSISTGLVAGLVTGLGLLILLLVLRRPVVEASGASRGSDLPVFGTVTLPRSGRGGPPGPEDARGLAPVCRQLLDWSPGTVILTGPDTAGLERQHLARLLGDVFASIRQLPVPGADGESADGVNDDRSIAVVDGSSSVDLISPGARSFVVLAVPVGIGVARLRDLARDLTGVPAAIVLVRTRGRRRRRSSSGAVTRRGGSDDRHRADPAPPAPVTPPAAPVTPPAAPVTAAAPVAPATDAVALDTADVGRPPAGTTTDTPPGGTGDPAAPPPLQADPWAPEPVDLTPPTAAGPPAAPAAPVADTDAVLRWVASRVSEWLPGVATARGGASLRLDGIQDRARCRIYLVTVRGNQGASTVVVKQRLLDPRQRRRERFPDRPTLSPELDIEPGEAAQLEYEGLRLAYDSIGTGHASARAVRPWGYDTDLAVVAMEQVRAPTLRDVAGQLPSAFAFQPHAPWSSAGSWLRQFHELAPDVRVPMARTRAGEIERQLHRYGEFFHHALGRNSLVEDFVQVASAVAARGLSRRIKSGLAHGDFVAQNTFVHPDGTVSVIDPFPSQRVPVYEDLGRMIVGARLFEPSTVRPAYGSPSVRPRMTEIALLSAYFGAGNVPIDGMRVFLGLCTLDKWADSLSKQPRNPVRRLARRPRLTVVNHWYRRELALQLELMLSEDPYRRSTWL